MEPIDPTSLTGTQAGWLSGTQTGPDVPRRVVASYPTYEDAQAAVEKLATERFPVEHLAIVGSDLRVVEQVTGRMDWSSAAVLGAAAGAPVGAALALLSALFFNTGSVLGLVLYWLLGGAVAGAMLGVLSYSRAHGMRDFSSFSRMEANRFDLMATDDVAHEALSRLTQTGTTPRWPSNARQ